MSAPMRALAALAAVALVAGSCRPATTEPSGTAPATAASAAPSSDPPVACVPPEVPASNWWDDRVFYEVFVRSFRDSDGDGIGDLPGLIDRLDYLNDGDPAGGEDLGVTGIWLMPVSEAASYHGYDVVDYEDIEADYGTTDDMRRLIEEAHDRGIAVIVDLVMNHTSIEHPWFQDALTPGSDHDDWYLWADQNPGYAGPDGQRVWHAAGDRFYYGLFWEGMPDLNLENPDVQAELDAVARYWLVDLGVDGFRLDAIKHFVEEGREQEDTAASHAWLAGFHDRVRSVKEDALLVGEVFDASIVSSSYVPDAVDLTFDFELAGKLLNSVRAGHGETVSAGQAKALERYPGGQYGAFLTNHDQNRVGTTLRGEGAMHVAASLLLTNPGIPFVYYGEEIGLPGAKPDERIRSPMPWNDGVAGGFTTGMPWEPLEEGWETRNVAAQTADDGSLLSHYRALVHLRGDLPALRTGAWQAFGSDATSVYAFLVRGEDESAAVVVNLGDESVADYALEMDAAATCGTGAATLAYADGYAAPPVLAGFDDPGAGSDAMSWQPVPELPAHSTLVVRLSP